MGLGLCLGRLLRTERSNKEKTNKNKSPVTNLREETQSPELLLSHLKCQVVF